MKHSLFTLLFAILCIGDISAQEDKVAKMLKNYPENYAGTTDIIYINSKESDVTYKIHIYLPVTYYQSQKQYPLMILTDGFYAMDLARASFNLLTTNRIIPEVIVAGIDYPYSNMDQLNRHRFRDMFSTRVEGYNPSGKADQFVAFMEKEVIPMMEDNFRVDSTDRCYVGHSGGGILGSHILLEKPGLFNRYIIGSPAYWWDNKEIIQRLSEREKVRCKRNTIVYTYVGEKEGNLMVNHWKEFNTLLKARINDRIKLYEQIYKDENHVTVIPTAFMRSVMAVYKDE